MNHPEEAPRSAGEELRFIRDIVARTHQRIDTHTFHCVHWGFIVLVWYPLANVFQLTGHPWWQLPLGIGALLLGFALSAAREMRLRKRPRLSGENTFISRQVSLIVFAGIVTGMILSGIMPVAKVIEGEDVPILWGLVYANMAFMIGVVYNLEFLYSGILIFAAVIAAIAFQDYNGLILGPFMGLGLIVPGVRAERRVRRIREESGGREPDAV